MTARAATALPPLDDATVEAAAAAVADAVRAGPVAPVGGRTHWEVGGPPPVGATAVRAPSGVVAFDPAELTVTVGAGTPVGELAALLAASGQECVLDPRDPHATVGGTVAAGLSGRRRLRWGPLRDRVLEVRLVTGDGRHVKGGGPTVKNVTGYDLPRLLVGSLGTLGVLTRLVLRCQPRPAATTWSAPCGGDPRILRRRLHAPSCLWWDGRTTRVLVEGHPDDVAAELGAAGLEPGDGEPPWPSGAVRGRISVAPGRLIELGPRLDAVGGLRWAAELGVGTVHVAADGVAPVVAAREAAHASGGWLLREAGGGLDGFGVDLPTPAVQARVRDAFDPLRRCNPGRIPDGGATP